MELEGKTAIVTGASSGIGAATVRKLREAGVRVAGGACTVCPAGACASATEGETTATRAARSNTTANTIRLQDGNVMNLLSIQMGHTAYDRLHSVLASRKLGLRCV